MMDIIKGYYFKDNAQAYTGTPVSKYDYTVLDKWHYYIFAKLIELQQEDEPQPDQQGWPMD